MDIVTLGERKEQVHGNVQHRQGEKKPVCRRSEHLNYLRCILQCGAEMAHQTFACLDAIFLTFSISLWSDSMLTKQAIDCDSFFQISDSKM